MTCQTRKVPTTTTSAALKKRQRSGIRRCILRPSRRSSRHSATSATMVATMAPIIAASFKGVGVVENLVSMVVDSDSPGGAGPTRSVNTPTMEGRRFGSANPVRSSSPVVGSVSPTNLANVPASVDAISILEHPGVPAAPTARARCTLAITTFRSVMSTRWGVTVRKSALSVACLARFGAVPSTIPPPGGIDRITSHGTVAVIDTGVSEISGAVTLLS